MCIKYMAQERVKEEGDIQNVLNETKIDIVLIRKEH